MSLRKIKQGIQSTSAIIGQTAGANGRLVIVNNGVETLSTKDGVSVARFYSEKDPAKQAGVKLVQQVCGAQLAEHGDGTTATAVMFGSLCRGHISDREIRAIDDELDALTPYLIKSAGTLYESAFTSANYNRDISLPIAEAVSNNGPDGLYMCEQAPVKGIVAETVNGFYFQGGYADPYCVNTATGRAEFNEPMVWCKSEYNLNDLMPIVGRAMTEGRALIIIGTPDEQARQSLKDNHLKGVLMSAIVIPEKIGRALDVLISDIQHVLGGEFGVVSKASISPRTTILTHDKDCAEYAESIKNAEAGSEPEKNENEMRAARLNGKVCLIKVGARTASDLRQFSDQVDDCLRSTISAARYGTCAGGGLGLLNAVHHPRLRRAVKAYMRAIGDTTGQKKLNPLGARFIDSRGVVVSAIKNAWRVARQVHRTGGTIIIPTDGEK